MTTVDQMLDAGADLHDENTIDNDEGDGGLSDFDSLEAALESALGLAPAKPKGEFDDLEDLLSESIEQRDETLRVKELRQKLSSGAISDAAERKAINALVESWNVRRLWTPVAGVFMFERQVCACGETHISYQGVYQRQSPREGTGDRWVKSSEEVVMGLKKEHKVMDVAVKHCILCVADLM